MVNYIEVGVSMCESYPIYVSTNIFHEIFISEIQPCFVITHKNTTKRINNFDAISLHRDKESFV
jgi:hypothetical protein